MIGGGSTGDRCGVLSTCTAVGSTAWAQQPHVTQVGGQLLWSEFVCSKAPHGSPMATAVTPERLSINSAQSAASAKRTTDRFYTGLRRISRLMPGL